MANDLRAPRASAAKVAYHQKQLLKMLARADDAAFLQMIWAVDALQSGRESAAKPYLSEYPKQAAADSSLETDFGIHRWELETLLVQLFLVPKELPRSQGNFVLDCTKFDSIRETINRLRSLENVESAQYLSGDFTILGELHRIGHRQFHWQTGYLNRAQVYRYSFIYAQGLCAEYFKRQFGIEIADFMLACFGAFVASHSKPWISRNISLPKVGLTEELFQKAFSILAISRDDARTATSALVAGIQEAHGSPLPTALLPSILRRTPLVFVDDPNQLICAVPEMILLRMTASLYYDLVGGGQDVVNDANTRFEQYCVDLIGGFMERFDVRGDFRYGPKGAQFDSPDVLVADGDSIAIVAECKATRLTYLAQFAEDPFEAAKKQYSQIAKGIFQLWRFFSHVRRGIADASLSADCYPLVLTLDSFLQIGPVPGKKILAEANALADEEDDISPDDRKFVAICPITDLEYILTLCTEDSFLASLKAASEEKKYEGWMLRQVHVDRGATKNFGKPNSCPFDLSNVLPWWNLMDELKENEQDA